MRYFALASDYDGTLAEHGVVTPDTLTALEKLKKTGRRLLLVTGRELPDLKATFPGFSIFDLIVAENGALLFDPATNAESVLAEPPPEKFVERLRRHHVPLSAGRVIVSTFNEYKNEVLESIEELGLELHVIFNKGSLMVLPSGVNKATGLAAGLKKLSLSPRNVVAVGDAENDHAFLAACERGVAVANALSSLQEAADLVTHGEAGRGVEELIDNLIENDLKQVPAQGSSDKILLGSADSGEIEIPAYGSSLLLAGTSGGGKSTLTTGFMERLSDAKYQFFAIDPEGDYQNFEGALILGDAKGGPTIDGVLGALESPEQSVIINLLALNFDDRPVFFENLLPHLHALRERTGRPHWLIFDEAHHLMPASRVHEDAPLPGHMLNTMLITLEPDHLPKQVLRAVDMLLAVGGQPGKTVQTFCTAAGGGCPSVGSEPLKKGTALFWSKSGNEPVVFNVAPCRTERVRHSRKYASAELSPDRSFYFRGPQGKLNLRAQNLMTFVQLLEGVDDETWLHHLRQGEYSQWFRENIKSEELASVTAEIEKQKNLTAEESRARVKEEVEQRYILPA